MQALRVCGLTFVLLFGCYPSFAGERTSRTFLPARFGTGPDSLLAQLECPRKRGPSDRTVVFCQAHVLADGRIARDRDSLANSYCFSVAFQRNSDGSVVPYRSQRYAQAMYAALRKARFLPAEIDGVAVAVSFSFQALFEDKEGCFVTALPNLGFERTELGAGYVAPQEILTEGSWTTRSENPFSSFLYRGGFVYSMSVMVDTNGEAYAGRVENPTRDPTPNEASAVSALENSRFIPGFYRGVPHPMRYLGILPARF